MIIICEGMEGSGKNSIIKEINKTLKSPILKMFNRKSWLKNEIEISAEVYNNLLLDLKHELIICNRAIISSLVYSKIYNRKYDLDYIYKKILPGLKKDSLFVFLYANNYKENLKRRPRDKFIDSKLYKQIYDEYFRVFDILEKVYHMKVLRINTSENNIRECRNIILEAIDNE